MYVVGTKCIYIFKSIAVFFYLISPLLEMNVESILKSPCKHMSWPRTIAIHHKQLPAWQTMSKKWFSVCNHWSYTGLHHCYCPKCSQPKSIWIPLHICNIRPRPMNDGMNDGHLVSKFIDQWWYYFCTTAFNHFTEGKDSSIITGQYFCDVLYSYLCVCVNCKCLSFLLISGK